MTLAFQQVAEEAHRRMCIASALHQHINGIAVLIHGSPEILRFALDGHKHFIKMPRITETTLSFLQFPRIGWPKLSAPLTNSFIGDGDATFGQQFFDFTETEAETMVQPDGVANNFRRKAMALVAGLFGFHAAQSAKGGLS